LIPLALTGNTDTLGIPMVWISVVVPVAMIIILIHLAARLASDTPDATSETQLD
jgi:TRAP-type C4-dicarboxylate transport system permease small subunit